MAIPIASSVGRGGTNADQDVVVVAGVEAEGLHR